VQLPDDLYLALVQRYGVRGLSKGVAELLYAALKQAQAPQPPVERKPQLPPPPPPPPPAAEERKPSRLDDLEDAALIRPRNPEAFLKACGERGLLSFELSPLGAQGLYLVCTRSWAGFVTSAAAGDRTPPSRVEQLAREAVKDGVKRLSGDEKYVLTLFALNRQGELLWDGERWKPLAGSG